MPTVRMAVKSSANRKFAIEGTALTRAEALDEFNAVAGLTGGTSLGNPTISDVLTGAELGAVVLPAAVDAENAVIVLQKTGTRNKVRRFQNMITSIKNPDGTVNVLAAPIVTFQAAYRDGSGVGGYTALKGRYTRK